MAAGETTAGRFSSSYVGTNTNCHIQNFNYYIVTENLARDIGQLALQRFGSHVNPAAGEDVEMGDGEQLGAGEESQSGGDGEEQREEEGEREDGHGDRPTE